MKFLKDKRLRTAYLSLGSNLGDRFDLLSRSIFELQKSAGVAKNISAFYKTEPVGVKTQPFFLNCCIMLETVFSPEKLLSLCQSIEKKLGRPRPATRNKKWGPRVIDIDILFYEGQMRHNPNLILPHPEIPLRRFVLQPLTDIAPNFRHPILKKTIKELLKECTDTSIVRLADDHARPPKTRHAIPDRHPVGRA